MKLSTHVDVKITTENKLFEISLTVFKESDILNLGLKLNVFSQGP